MRRNKSLRAGNEMHIVSVMQSQLFTISVMYYILSRRLVQGTPAEEALKKGELIYEEEVCASEMSY